MYKYCGCGQRHYRAPSGSIFLSFEEDDPRFEQGDDFVSPGPWLDCPTCGEACMHWSEMLDRLPIRRAPSPGYSALLEVAELVIDQHAEETFDGKRIYCIFCSHDDGGSGQLDEIDHSEPCLVLKARAAILKAKIQHAY